MVAKVSPYILGERHDKPSLQFQPHFVDSVKASETYLYIVVAGPHEDRYGFLAAESVLLGGFLLFPQDDIPEIGTIEDPANSLGPLIIIITIENENVSMGAFKELFFFSYGHG